MRERDWRNQMEERARELLGLGEERGLKALSGNLEAWVPKDQKTGIFPNHFFTIRLNEEGKHEFEEHRIEFPIKDISQLSAFLRELNVLYEGVEGAVVFDRNDPTEFIQFVRQFC